MKKSVCVLLVVFLTIILSSCKEKGGTEYNTPPVTQRGSAPSVLPGTLSDQEITTLKDIVNREPDNVNAWIRLGNIYMDSKRNHEAISAYENALRLDPGNVDVTVDMGTCYRRIGMPEKALEIFKKATATDPNHPFAHRNSGVVLAYDLKKYDEAIKELETYLKIDPKAPDANKIAGLIQELKSKK